LDNLVDISQIKTFDLAGHILDVLMDHVHKYQSLSPESLQQDHQIASCLAILAIHSSFFCLSDFLLRTAPVVFTIEFLAKPLRALFPPIHGGGHPTNAVGVVL
jgi:hypothetical protein